MTFKWTILNAWITAYIHTHTNTHTHCNEWSHTMSLQNSTQEVMYHKPNQPAHINPPPPPQKKKRKRRKKLGSTFQISSVITTWTGGSLTCDFLSMQLFPYIDKNTPAWNGPLWEEQCFQKELKADIYGANWMPIFMVPIQKMAPLWCRCLYWPDRGVTMTSWCYSNWHNNGLHIPGRGVHSDLLMIHT